mmetsp:Transcript_7488/g.16340  ORF Transcript_7488/g.16340 Transcript_7488/m.16340 type:complete len:80 (-) Transcript_7488:487-726(-)
MPETPNSGGISGFKLLRSMKQKPMSIMNMTNVTLSTVNVFVTALDSSTPFAKSQTERLDMINAGVLKLNPGSMIYNNQR